MGVSMLVCMYVCVCVCVSSQLHNLEVWVYEEAPEVGGEANVYVHHELVLPNFPLCIEWMDCDPRSAQDRGNLVAVSVTHTHTHTRTRMHARRGYVYRVDGL